MKKRLALLLLVFTVVSCSKFQKLTKNPDMDAKYNGAIKYYDKKDYYHALQLFEELISVYKGTAKAEDSYYYYSYCTYFVDDYQTAAYYFNNFVQTIEVDVDASWIVVGPNFLTSFNAARCELKLCQISGHH